MRSVLIIILVFASVCLGVGGYVAYQVFGPSVKNPSGSFLYIPRGAVLQQVKDSLDFHKFLHRPVVFDKVAAQMKLEKSIKPGKYKVEDGMSVYHLVKKLRAGRQESINLVINKLRVKEDLARGIGKIFEVDSSEAMNFLTSDDSLRRFEVDTNTVFTDVFPDTYTYFWAADMSTIFNKLYLENKKFWSEERKQKAGRLGLTTKEVYIIASIIEEETNKQVDKGKIASVYINRLKRGMKLEADPTVKFSMRDFGLKRILYKHLEVESPYNLYKNTGLPPGPICTPSRSTIQAVLDAPETDYLFFAAKPDFSGFSNFAATYPEHQKNARAYQQALARWMKEQKQNQNNSQNN